MNVQSLGDIAFYKHHYTTGERRSDLSDYADAERELQDTVQMPLFPPTEVVPDDARV